MVYRTPSDFQPELQLVPRNSERLAYAEPSPCGLYDLSLGVWRPDHTHSAAGRWMCYGCRAREACCHGYRYGGSHSGGGLSASCLKKCSTPSRLRAWSWRRKPQPVNKRRVSFNPVVETSQTYSRETYSRGWGCGFPQLSEKEKEQIRKELAELTWETIHRNRNSAATHVWVALIIIAVLVLQSYLESQLMFLFKS